MSAAIPRDPLLATVRIILGLAMALAATVAAGLVIAVPMAFLMRDRILVEVAGLAASPTAAILAIAGLLTLAALVAALAFLFLRHLSRIVGSVGEGDPFVPANAARLAAMAWITVAIHATAWIMALITDWVDDVARNTHIEIDVPLSGLFIALILFILARVFREGTRMREELEGMV